MTKLRILTPGIVVAHWAVAIWHLFLAARILPAPNNQVSWMALVLITLGHLAVSVALWRFSGRLAGLATLIFFPAALSADVYEHFLHPSANNVFMVASGDWSDIFIASVIVLLALEILGCLLGVLSLGGKTPSHISSQSMRPKKSSPSPPSSRPQSAIV